MLASQNTRARVSLGNSGGGPAGLWGPVRFPIFCPQLGPASLYQHARAECGRSVQAGRPGPQPSPRTQQSPRMALFHQQVQHSSNCLLTRSGESVSLSLWVCFISFRARALAGSVCKQLGPRETEAYQLGWPHTSTIQSTFPLSRLSLHN